MAKPNCMGIAMFCKPFSHINTLHFSGWYRAEIEDNKSQQQQAVCYQKFLLIAKENNSKSTDVYNTFTNSFYASTGEFISGHASHIALHAKI